MNKWEKVAFWIMCIFVIGLLFVYLPELSLTLCILGLFIGVYLYYSYRLTKIALDVGIKDNLWLAYIPIAQNYILYKIAKTPLWVFIVSLLYLPILILFSIIAKIYTSYKVVKRFGYSGWWILLFSLWVLFVYETKKEINLREKEEKSRLEYYEKHKDLIEKENNKKFINFLKIIGIIALIVLASYLIFKFVF